MQEFKRNQVEEAIVRMAYPHNPRAAAEVRNRLKRLLDTDRTLGRNSRSSDPERANYAFFSSEEPGKGIEVKYSAYEAFALHMGFMLLSFGHPQRLAVLIARRARPELEPRYPGIVRSDSPHFLVIVARQKRQQVVRSVNVLAEAELGEFLDRERRASASSYSPRSHAASRLEHTRSKREWCRS